MSGLRWNSGRRYGGDKLPFTPDHRIALPLQPRIGFSREITGRGYAAKGPDRGAADQGRWIVESAAGRGDQLAWGLRYIADRDQHIAQETVAADALHRGAGEAGAEAGIVEPGEFDQKRCGQPRPRQKLGLL